MVVKRGLPEEGLCLADVYMKMKKPLPLPVRKASQAQQMKTPLFSESVCKKAPTVCEVTPRIQWRTHGGENHPVNSDMVGL